MQVSFEIADITTCALAPESYNVVYSRDTILHIHNKPALFKRWVHIGHRGMCEAFVISRARRPVPIGWTVPSMVIKILMSLCHSSHFRRVQWFWLLRHRANAACL